MWTTELNSNVYAKLLAGVHKAETVGSSKHTAALVYRGKIISVGYNKLKSHPIMLKYHKSGQVYLHAEIDAIIRAINKFDIDILPHCELFCLRIKAKQGVVANSKPCCGCANLIKSFGITKVYWT